MFSSSKNIESLQELFVEFKRYVELQRRYVLLDTVNKMAILLSGLVVGLILFMLGAIALLYLSFTFATFLSQIVGSMAISCAIITAFFILLAIIVYAKRKVWIMQPLCNFLYRLFIDTDKENKDASV